MGGGQRVGLLVGPQVAQQVGLGLHLLERGRTQDPFARFGTGNRNAEHRVEEVNLPLDRHTHEEGDGFRPDARLFRFGGGQQDGVNPQGSQGIHEQPGTVGCRPFPQQVELVESEGEVGIVPVLQLEVRDHMVECRERPVELGLSLCLRRLQQAVGNG